MGSRKFRERIELWRTATASDGFGGVSSSTPTLLFTFWCNIKTMGINSKYARNTSDGLVNNRDGIVITIRKNADITLNPINQFFVYKGVNYVFQNNPVDVNMRGDIIEIVAVSENVKSVS